MALTPTAEQRKVAFLILLAPFLLNDFAFIALKGGWSVYAVDYAVRILALAVILLWPAGRAIAFEEYPARQRTALAILTVIGLTIAGRLLIYLVEAPFAAWAGWTVLFQFPRIQSPAFYWLDLTFGLALVALSEELIFRKFALSWLRSAGRPDWQIVIISAVLFALVHWSKGLGNISIAFLLGLLYMAAYLKLKRLWPLVYAHWTINFLIFASR